MKKLMTTTVAVIAFCASAATIEQLNAIQLEDITAANAAKVLDAAIATTNTTKITKMVKLDKVSVEDAVHKTMTMKPFSMCRAAFDGSTVTNHALQAEALAQLDYTKLELNDFMHARYILLMNQFYATEAGRAEAARIANANVIYGAMVYCTAYTCKYIEAFKDIAPEMYAKAKPLVKSSGNQLFMAIMIQYGFGIAHDYDGFAEIYNKDLLSTTYWWANVMTSMLQYRQYMKDQLAMWKAVKPSSRGDDQLLRIAKIIDRTAGDKTATLSIIDQLSTSKQKLHAALYCNNEDKLIDTLIACDMSLTAVDINAAIAPLNSLDPDYRKADVLKALRAVNQRYTLKLYDDRDTWEPVLSKIRAMIDCR